MTTANTISNTKANRLFWLGRYVERVYTCLHLVRKYLDEMIDESQDAYISYCEKVGIPCTFDSADDFARRYLYDDTDANSIYSSMKCAFDNGIELRDDIKSESLSYIELSLTVIKKCAANGAKCADLQAVTDYLLSFWGSVDERVLDARAKCLLRLGRCLESLELHVRFGYDLDRITDIYLCIDQNLAKLPEVYSKIYYAELNSLMSSHADAKGPVFRTKMIRAINSLFIISL